MAFANGEIKQRREISQRDINKLQKKNQNCFDNSNAEIRKYVENFRSTYKSTFDSTQGKFMQQELKIKVRQLKENW